MKLLAVRDLNTQDPLPALGPKVEPPAPAPPPALRPTATPGIMQRPDGKLETDLPLPPPDPLALAKDVHKSVAAEFYKKAFDTRKERCGKYLYFSGTDRKSWWMGSPHNLPKGPDAKRLMHARNYGAQPEDFRKLWETDFDDAERRVLAQELQGVPEAALSWINEQSIKKFFP